MKDPHVDCNVSFMTEFNHNFENDRGDNMSLCMIVVIKHVTNGCLHANKYHLRCHKCNFITHSKQKNFRF
jgi:hypothetical protein